MTRRAKGGIALPVALIVALVLVANPVLAGGLRTFLFAFPPSEIQWQKGQGVPEGRGSNHGLYMNQPDAVTPGGLAGAVIDGIAGATLDTLGFDHKNGGTCSSVSPRFRVLTEPNGDSYTFACAGGMHAPSTADPVNWTRVRFANADAVPGDPAFPWLGFGNVTVRDVRVVHGSRTEAGPEYSGVVYLDNLAVNDVLIGKPGNN